MIRVGFTTSLHEKRDGAGLRKVTFSKCRILTKKWTKSKWNGIVMTNM